MPVAVAFVLGFVAALAATIVAWIMIVPDKKRAGLNKFFRYIHDLFNFKSLWIEKIMKFLYILQTLACIGIGFFMLFSVMDTGWTKTYMGFSGVALIIVGPIVTRIAYEFVMMMILLVKNTIEINNKMIAQEGSVADKSEKEAAEKAQKEAEKEAARQQMRAQQRAQQQYAQPQYGQPQQYGQQYAQPQYGQQYAQQQYGQQYAQPQQYSQPQYGQPQDNNQQ